MGTKQPDPGRRGRVRTEALMLFMLSPELGPPGHLPPSQWPCSAPLRSHVPKTPPPNGSTSCFSWEMICPACPQWLSQGSPCSLSSWDPLILGATGLESAKPLLERDCDVPCLPPDGSSVPSELACLHREGMDRKGEPVGFSFP